MIADPFFMEYEFLRILAWTNQKGDHGFSVSIRRASARAVCFWIDMVAYAKLGSRFLFFDGLVVAMAALERWCCLCGREGFQVFEEGVGVPR